MARSRTLSPLFFKDEDLAAKSERARLGFLGLLTIADREGRLEYRPLLIRVEIFPHEQDIDVENVIAELAAERRWSRGSFLTVYEVDGRRYIQINNFLKYQHPHPKEPASVIPPPNAGKFHGEQCKGRGEQKVGTGKVAASNGKSGTDRAGSSIPSIPSGSSGSSSHGDSGFACVPSTTTSPARVLWWNTGTMELECEPEYSVRLEELFPVRREALRAAWVKFSHWLATPKRDPKTERRRLELTRRSDLSEWFENRLREDFAEELAKPKNADEQLADQANDRQRGVPRRTRL